MDRTPPAPADTTSPRRRAPSRVGLAALASVTMAVAGGFVGARVAAQSAPSASAPSHYVAIDGFRAYDSRTIDDRERIDSQRIIGLQRYDGVEPRIPTEAVAVAYTVTATATEGSGYAALQGLEDERTEIISNLAWTGSGQREVNSGIVPTFRGDNPNDQLARLTVGGTGAAAHVVIDVVGYLLPAD
ncbi:hypothetical protein [Ilumatobacter sp.]|uniref:hypothetical protein n=1 Tax=Ilumatobacter sp. TaxID=1967498 RepID=UPI003B52B928